MACKKFLTFNNGVKMPALGIGTWQVSFKIERFSNIYFTIQKVS